MGVSRALRSFVAGQASTNRCGTVAPARHINHPMKFAYADPPYLGCGSLYAKHHPEAMMWDDPEAHRQLIRRLSVEWPDGWAMSLSSPSHRVLLPMCPDDVRVLSWVKPFAIFKPNVGVAYAWDPVIVRGGRRRTREQAT